MYILNKKGIQKNGKLEIEEKNKQDKKIIIIEFNEELIKEVEKIIKEIELFLINNKIPETKMTPKCKKCAYYEYCAI